MKPRIQKWPYDTWHVVIQGQLVPFPSWAQALAFVLGNPTVRHWYT